jgi:hypothetical protein
MTTDAVWESVSDALGNPIEVGEIYGYSIPTGGGARTVIGKALKTANNTGKVTLSVKHVQNYLYGAKTIGLGIAADQVTIRSYLLFPVLNYSQS